MQTDRHVLRHTDKPADMYIHANRQTEQPTDKHNRHTDTDRQTDKLTHAKSPTDQRAGEHGLCTTVRQTQAVRQIHAGSETHTGWQ